MRTRFSPVSATHRLFPQDRAPFLLPFPYDTPAAAWACDRHPHVVRGALGKHFWRGTCAPQQLTARGRQQMKRLGAEFRKRYQPFIDTLHRGPSRQLTHRDLYLRATEVNGGRTRESIASFVEGAFPELVSHSPCVRRRRTPHIHLPLAYSHPFHTLTERHHAGRNVPARSGDDVPQQMYATDTPPLPALASVHIRATPHRTTPHSLNTCRQIRAREPSRSGATFTAPRSGRRFWQSTGRSARRRRVRSGTRA